MSDAKNNGKTLWEILTHKGASGPVPIEFYNPLDLRVHSIVKVPAASGPEFLDYDFSVGEIREYTRRIGEERFKFTDYVLKGINSKTLDANDTVIVRVRVFPNDRGTRDAILLRLYDEMEFSEDFLAVVKDTTGVFEINNDEANEHERYTRINDVEGSYEGTVRIISATTDDGKAKPDGLQNGKFEYWDYWREVSIGGDKTTKLFLFVEMNADNGWFQIWRGTEYFE